MSLHRRSAVIGSLTILCIVVVAVHVNRIGRRGEARGFPASLVRDFLSGRFILFEDQFVVGAIVNLD